MRPGARIERLALPEVALITGVAHADARGDFQETFRADLAAEAGFARPVAQENLVRTRRAGTLRGLHLQREPHGQEKLIQVLAGEIFDVVVDARPGSPTVGRSIAVRLSAAEPRQLFAPRGFAHGYLTLTGDCAVLYRTGAPYAPAAELGLRWNDPALAIAWPLPPEAIVMNPRDATWPDFAQVLASLAG